MSAPAFINNSFHSRLRRRLCSQYARVDPTYCANFTPLIPLRSYCSSSISRYQHTTLRVLTQNLFRKRSINRILKYRRRKLEAERNGERVRRSRAKIGEIVPICRFSGQRQAEFCQQRGFELSTQQNYLQREKLTK